VPLSYLQPLQRLKDGSGATGFGTTIQTRECCQTNKSVVKRFH